MANIIGTAQKSGTTVLSARLTVTLDSPLKDFSTTPNVIHFPVPEVFTIAGGVININLPESATQQITYHFVLESVYNVTSYFIVADGTEWLGEVHQWSGDSQYYTGAIHSDDSKILSRVIYEQADKLDDFHAVVPNETTVEYSELQGTGITTDVLDSSLRRLAYELSHVAEFIDALRWVPDPDPYDPAVYYRRGDSVFYAGSSWIYVYPDPAQNKTPTDSNSTYWKPMAKKGDPGGTNGQDTPYDATGWDGAIWAPTANVLRDKIETLATKAEIADVIRYSGLGGLTSFLWSSPALTGNPTTTDQNVNSAFNSNNSGPVGDCIANCRYVKAAANRYSKIAELQSAGVNAGPAVVGMQTRVLNTIVTNAGDVIQLASNAFTLRAGTYRIFASAPGYRVDNHRLHLWNTSTNARVLSGAPMFTINNTYVLTFATLKGQFTISSPQVFEIRHYCGTAAAVNGLGAAMSDSYPEIYTEVELWRVD